MAAETKLEDAQWTSICERIRKGRCVAFLGAGVNVGNKTYEGLPLGGKVAKALLKEMIRTLPNDEVRYLSQKEAKQLLDADRTTDAQEADDTQTPTGTVPAPSATSADGGTEPSSPGTSAPGLLDSVVTVISHDDLENYQDLLQLRLSDLGRVALRLQTQVDHDFLMGRLKIILAHQKLGPSQLLKTLAQLPFSLIVTTNYDCLMERALEEDGDPRYKRALDEEGKLPPYKLVVQPTKGFGDTRGGELNKELSDWISGQRSDPARHGPILYKIHGTLPDPKRPASAPNEHGTPPDPNPTASNPTKPVLITEEDYIQFLTVIGQEKVGVPDAIKRLMMTSSLLFLGYSLQDWDFRTLRKALVEPLEATQKLRSFAIQWKPSPFWVKLWEKDDIEIFDIDLHTFALDLSKEYLDRVTPPN